MTKPWCRTCIRAETTTEMADALRVQNLAFISGEAVSVNTPLTAALQAEWWTRVLQVRHGLEHCSYCSCCTDSPLHVEAAVAAVNKSLSSPSHNVTESSSIGPSASWPLDRCFCCSSLPRGILGREIRHPKKREPDHSWLPCNTRPAPAMQSLACQTRSSLPPRAVHELMPETVISTHLPAHCTRGEWVCPGQRTWPQKWTDALPGEGPSCLTSPAWGVS